MLFILLNSCLRKAIRDSHLIFNSIHLAGNGLLLPESEKSVTISERVKVVWPWGECPWQAGPERPRTPADVAARAQPLPVLLL